jgi:predicted flavoprotein YhiN
MYWNGLPMKALILRTEADGRMFPVTNQSSTIANALYERALRNGTEIRLKTHVEQIDLNACWSLKLSDDTSIQTTYLLIATGMASCQFFALVIEIRYSHSSADTFHLYIQHSG